MAFFDKLFSAVSAPKEKSALGVDVGSSSLKVVQLRREGGKAVLETYGELALGPYGGAEVGQATNLSAEQVAQTLRDLLREAKVTTKSCGVSIPFSRSLLTLVKLPYRKDEKEQKTIIELEARKYIPAPVSEVQLDWFIVPESERAAKEKTQVEVLFIAVHNDELAFLKTVVEGAALAASFYEIEIFSTIRAVVDEPVKPVMVIDIGAASTKIYVIERGVVAFSHSVSTGSQDVTRVIATSENLGIANAEVLKKKEGLAGADHEAVETVFSGLFSEAHRVLVQYETSHQKPLSGIVLTGGGGVTAQLAPYAQNLFSVPVRVADPFSKTEAPAFMRPVLAEIGPEFAVAVGLALRKLEE